ncbi:MAG TPA: TadE/TadG family type IV pilus assembly protein [Myxococcales bacterium]|nr:TadE/TadG family type IV pilus assembly protein [Myxococcales bacterium]
MFEREEGQAVVEAALVLPAMIFLLLLTIQLTQLQRARILADYAAFAAARTGIVYNGDPDKMKDAATMAILPGYGRTDGFIEIGKTLARFKVAEAALTPLGLEQVRIYVHNPVAADFAQFGQHLDGQEIDFDDVRPGATEATLLSLQVRYLYELRVPFANKLIQTVWLAAHAGLLARWRGWDLTGPRLAMQNGPDAVAVSRIAAAGTRVADGTPEGIPIAALVTLGNAAGRFFLPVEAFYTMRMQSNPYLKWARP